MEGPCERSLQWQNLKFAEISVWRRVSDLLFHALLVIPSFISTWTSVRGVVHAFLWVPADPDADMLKAMRNFSITHAAAPLAASGKNKS